MKRISSSRLAFCVLLAMAQAGCQRVTKDMAEQPRYNPSTSSPAFANGQATRAPVPGSEAHARGNLAYASGGRAGVLDGTPAAQPPLSDALLLRGHERYEIYCLPCHGARGAGDGEVVRRGFPAPPGFATAGASALPDARLHEIILRGSGTMYPFADRVSAEDAWAVVAYMRALQRQADVGPGAANSTSAPDAGGSAR